MSDAVCPLAHTPLSPHPTPRQSLDNSKLQNFIRNRCTTGNIPAEDGSSHFRRGVKYLALMVDDVRSLTFSLALLLFCAFSQVIPRYTFWYNVRVQQKRPIRYIHRKFVESSVFGCIEIIICRPVCTYNIDDTTTSVTQQSVSNHQQRHQRH